MKVSEKGPSNILSGGPNKKVSLIGLLIVIVIVIAGAAVIFKVTSCTEKAAEAPAKSIENAGKVIDIFASKLVAIAEAFKTGKVDIIYTSHVTKVYPTLRLQVAEAKSRERFKRKDSKAYFWNSIPTPDVEVEINIPVTYTYYVELGGWHYSLTSDKKDIIVCVPRLKSNEPAPDISAMETTVRGSIFRFDEKDIEEKLKAGITEELKKTAQDNIENLSIHELARVKAEEMAEGFLRSWIEKDYDINFDDFNFKIVIIFNDESSVQTKSQGFCPKKNGIPLTTKH